MVGFQSRGEGDPQLSMRRTRGRRNPLGNRRRQTFRFLERLEDRTLLSFTPIALPGDTLPNSVVYTSGTTNLASLIPMDGDTTTTLTDGTQTLTFSRAMTAATAPTTWANWGSPPNTESATPRVLYTTSESPLTLNLSKPADVFGFEMEQDNFGTFSLTASFYEGATLVGSVPLTVTTPGRRPTQRRMAHSCLPPRPIRRSPAS